MMPAIWHNRSLQLLLAALVIAVSAMTSVALFVERVDRGLVLQGASLMAADLVVQHSDELPPLWQQQADAAGLRYSRQVNFPSVLFAGDQPQLVQVKAVDQNYPLRGTLKVSRSGVQVNVPPVSGVAYLDSRLPMMMPLNDDAALPLGQLQLQNGGFISEEPDRGSGLFQLAPRVMISYEDIASSGLLGPASRARYRLLLAGETAAVENYRQWAQQNLPKGARIIDVQNARPELRTALQRGHRFLNLAVLCATLLSGIAILLATRNFINRSLDEAAVLRTIGMTASGIMWRYLNAIFAVLVMGVALGSLLGFAGQALLAKIIGGLLGEHLPVPGASAFLPGVLYGSILLAGFSIPALMRIRHVSPLRVIRRELTPPDVSVWLISTLAACSFLALVFWQAQDMRLALAVVAVLLVVIIVAMFAGSVVLKMLAGLGSNSSHLGLGVASLSRNHLLTRWQLAGFSLGISLLLILAIVRVDLVNTWLTSLPAKAPNHFLVNIQPDQQQGLQQWFTDNGIVNSGMYASSRGRLISIDGKKVEPGLFKSDRAEHLAAREYSLGFSDHLQSDNRIVEGDTWPPADPGFTVESELALKLGIKTGSQLVFDIAGQQLSAPVVSLRSISWDSFNVNFFVQATEPMMQGLPVAYLNSVYLQGNEGGVMRKLAADYAGVSLLDLRPILQQIRNIMDRGALAVQAVFAFTLFAAVMVTLAAVLVNRQEKAREIAILRTLGASRRQVLGALVAEFGLLGLTAGLVAATLASLTGYLVALQLFDLLPVFNPWLWLAGAGSGLLVLLGVGLMSSISLLNIPPLAIINRN